jgi:carboxyl-terminal processing protease
VPDARTFTLSDEEYNQFVNWMKGKDYQYKSALEYQLTEFTEEARKEKYFGELKTQLEQINARIAESKKNELMLHKDQIKMLLEEDIVSRYHLERGGIEAGFKYDNDVKKAIEIVHNQPVYKKTLSMQ